MSGILKKDKFQISLLVTLLILSIAYIIIGTIDYTVDEEYIANNFIFDSSYFFNNKAQTIQYLTILIGFVIVFPTVYCIIRKKRIKKKEIIEKIFKIILLALIIISLYSATKSIITFIVLLLILVIMYHYIYNRYDYLKEYRLKHQELIIILLSLYTSLLYIDTSFQQSHFLMHHVTAYYYPIHKILNGIIPYIDFNPLYGGYSYVFAGILKPFPTEIHLVVFSIITSLLVFISLLLTYKFLKSFLKNKKVLPVFLSFLFCNVYFTYMSEKSTYIQYMPHRYLSIIIMLNYILYYLKQPTTIKKIFGFLLCSLMIFWNFDSGLIVTIAYTLLIIYYQIYDRKYIKIPITLLLSGMSIAFSFIIIEIITYIKIGTFTDIKNIIFSTLLFSNSGFLSLELKNVSPIWIIVMVGYLIFLGISILNLFDKKTKDIGTVFFISILGLGIFVYYIQRPVLIKYMFIITPLIFLISKTELKKIRVLSYTINSILSLICLISITTSFKYKFLADKIEPMLKEQNRLLQTFSRDIGKENFEMYINCDTIYYELLNKKDIKRIPSYLDLFTKKDLKKLIEYIENSDKNIIVSYKLVNRQSEEFFTKRIKEKYYIYYTYDEENIDNYVFFIRKKDIKKISNIDEMTLF